MASQFWQQVKAAIKDGDADEVARLIGDDEAKLSMTTVFGPWLHLAADYGQLGIAKRLVAMGVDVNACGGVSKGTALAKAADKGHRDVIEFLLSCGAELDVSAPECNPLFGAIYGGHKSVAQLLLDKGIDPHVTYMGDSGKPKNALSFAHDQGQAEIVAVLKAIGCEVPVDHSVAHHEEAHQELIAAIATQFDNVSELALQEIFPVDDEVSISIHVIRPSAEHPCLTLFTTGMSDKAMETPDDQEEYQFAELLIHLPADWPLPLESDSSEEASWPTTWLRQIAYYPHLEKTWLGGHHTIISNDEPPEPFAANMKLSCMLLIADFADWSPVTVVGRRVHLYTLIPLYADERDFERKHGVQELLQQFERAGITTIVDVARMNVAEGAV